MFVVQSSEQLSACSRKQWYNGLLDAVESNRAMSICVVVRSKNLIDRLSPKQDREREEAAGLYI